MPLEAAPVAVALWYPVSASTPCAPLEYGGPPTLFRLPALAVDAPPAAAAGAPLVLLCGDRGRDALDLGWLGVHLARRGCVVAAATPPPGEGAAFVAASCRRVRALADAMGAAPLEGLPAPRERFLAAGFALGGIAALALAGATVDGVATGPEGPLQDTRVASLALLNPAPASLLRGHLSAVAVPVHVLVSAADRVALPAYNGERIAGALRDVRLTRLAAPAGHGVFHSEATREGFGRCPEWAADHAAVHRGSVHERCAALIAALARKPLPVVGHGAN